jgi:hypothetical protein
MAARLRPRNDDLSRAAIQTTQLVKRLNSYALAEKDAQTNKPVQMSSDQVRAALGLLRKTIPDLAVTAHTGPDGEKLDGFVIYAPIPSSNAKQWLADHAPQSAQHAPRKLNGNGKTHDQ